MTRQFKLYSDGACSGNPGPGAYGAIAVDAGGREKIFKKAFRDTTNNRMELLGIIEPLEQLTDVSEVEIVTDSRYVEQAINAGWLKGWVKRGWKKADKKPVLNQDLWERMLKLLEKHNLRFRWVKGHSSNPFNNRCDEIAVTEITNGKKAVDGGYKPKQKPKLLWDL